MIGGIVNHMGGPVSIRVIPLVLFSYSAKPLSMDAKALKTWPEQFVRELESAREHYCKESSSGTTRR
jgi:hypothetical protein